MIFSEMEITKQQSLREKHSGGVKECTLITWCNSLFWEKQQKKPHKSLTLITQSIKGGFFFLPVSTI